MRRKHLSLLIAVLAVLVLASVGTVVGKPAAASAATSISGLHVSGNQLLNDANQVVRPLGVDRAGTEYMCDNSSSTTVLDGPSDANSVNAMASWHINAVRVPLNEDCWLGINGYPAAQYSAAQYQQAIINYVNLLNSYHLIAILDLHWNAPGTQQSNGQMPTMLQPSGPRWRTLLSPILAASASPCNDVGFAVAGMQTLVNTVRSTGATNVIMLGGLAYSNNLSQWLANKPNDPDNNLAASLHLYNFNACSNTSCWDSQVAPVAAQVPVITGELGENDCQSSFINTAMSWFDQHNIGYLGWAWNTYDCKSFPSLITSYDGTPTAFGQGVKDHFAALASGSGGTPTPTPGASCKVSYTVPNQWNNGFTGNITLTNTGSTTINGWTLTFAFPGNQQLTSSTWNGNFSQRGNNVTITSVSYNAQLTPGAQATPGFNASWSGSNPSPTAFALNGTACSVG